MAESSQPQAAISYVDVKIHEVTNLPPSFLADSGNAPMFPDHPFRYEVSLSLGGGAATASATNGRLLSAIPMYRDFVQQAALAPLELNLSGGGADGGGAATARGNDVPSDVKAPPRTVSEKGGGDSEAVSGAPSGTSSPPPPIAGGGGGGANAASVVSSAPVQLLWVLTADSDAAEWRELESAGGGKKDTKPPPKGKGGAPVSQSPPPTDAVKPTAPNYTAAAPPCILRIPLTPALVEELEGKMEQSAPLVLHFRRSVRSNAPADWEDTQEGRYAATLAISLAALKEPGSVTLTATVPLQPMAVEPPKEEDKGGKKKAPAAKKGKGTAPSILSDELDPAEPHPYVANQTTATVTLTFGSALTRLPQSRPRVDLQPTDLIPTRLRPPRRPLDATKTFALEVESLTQRIVKEFREHVDTTGHNGEEARASFLNYLQSSGQAHAYKQLLIPVVQGIVKEKYLRQPNPSAEELNRVTNELYSYLTDTMHTTMHRVFHAMEAQQKGTQRSSIDGLSASERWKRRAMEAEVMKEYGLAAKYHQERLGATKPETVGAESLPNVWTEYAEFSLRVRDVLKAEQAFRESLAIDYAHLPSLLGYGMLLLSSARFQEAEVYLQSAVDLAPNTLTWGCLALLYDMKILALPEGPGSTDKRLQFQREAKYSITQATRRDQLSDATTPEMTASDAYEHVAKHAIQLYLEDLANLCLVKCAPSDAVEMHFATMFYQTEQYEEAAATLQKLTKSKPQDTRSKILLGDVLYAMGNVVEAEAQYNAAMRIDPFCGSGPSYVRLGNMCASLGKYRDALAAFMSGAKVWPCGLTWLGAGIAYYRLEDMLRAEQALNESNILNNLNPKCWGFLALLCLRQRREDEADQAFNQAIKLGLDDAFLVTEVGVEQLRIGRPRVAEMCFRRSLAIQDDVNTHMQLGRALCTLKRFDEAREEFQYVASNSRSDAQRMKAEEQIQMIPPPLGTS